MRARALSNASTTVKGNVISVIRQNCCHASASVPGAVMSVLHQHARADVEGSARTGARVGRLLLAEKPLTIRGLAQPSSFPPGGVDARVVAFVEIGRELETVG